MVRSFQIWSDIVNLCQNRSFTSKKDMLLGAWCTFESLFAYSDDSTLNYEGIDDNSLLQSLLNTINNGINWGNTSEGLSQLLSENFSESSDMMGNLLNFLFPQFSPENGPKAALNYLVFDNAFQLIPDASGLIQMQQSNGQWVTMSTNDEITVPKNGYLLVYVSSQANGKIYFDNLNIKITKGSLLEEAHYYPFGLPIKALSATFNLLKGNRHTYQGNEYLEGNDLRWMDFHARQYDPQLGRFLGIDPLAYQEGQQIYSPYAAMGNAPGEMIDPNGENAIVVASRIESGLYELQVSAQEFLQSSLANLLSSIKSKFSINFSFLGGGIGGAGKVIDSNYEVTKDDKPVIGANAASETSQNNQNNEGVRHI
jgi:RHS repeat-associated protein